MCRVGRKTLLTQLSSSDHTTSIVDEPAKEETGDI